MKFKIIASIVVLVVVLIAIVVGRAIRNSGDELTPDMAPVELTQ